MYSIIIINFIIEHSKNLAQKAIESLVELHKVKTLLEKEREDLETQFLSSDLSFSEVHTRLTILQSRLKALSTKIQQDTKALGLVDQANLQALLKNKFFQHWINACALKLQIWQCLQNRKFELKRLDWGIKNILNSEICLN